MDSCHLFPIIEAVMILAIKFSSMCLVLCFFFLSQRSWWALVHELWSFFRPKVKPFGCFIVVVDIPCPPQTKRKCCSGVLEWMVSPCSPTCGCGRRVVGACNLWMVQTLGRKVQSYWLRQVGNSFAWIVPGPADKTQEFKSTRYQVLWSQFNTQYKHMLSFKARE